MDVHETLKQYFGYDSFKPGQEEIIKAILNGKDVLAVMPTGSGKSVCYQVPAMLLPGITIVISPLISLMQDQVKALNEAGIHAGYINSSLTETQISKVYARALEGTYKILYVAPERLESGGFVNFAGRVEISMVTVDEAHCISQWGQDFRPSYLKIVDFIDSLGKRPIVSAFTATATEEVKTDISCVLKLRDPETVVTGFDRENLYFGVEAIKRKDDYILEYIRKHPDDSGIIYCATRKNVDALFELLSGSGVSAARYHAGMSNEDRKKSQDDFIYDRTLIIVATNAFGMGIDKSNVRFVIHYNMPQSMENYYQEAGRAGRDGEPSECILLFSPQDIMINKFLLDHKDFKDIPDEDIDLIRQRDAKRLQVMEGYCRTSGCLRNYILAYFGEKRDVPCDNCGNCHRDYTEIDMTEDAKAVINCVWETKGRYGLNIVLGTLLGANRARLKELGTTGYKTYGALKDRSEAELRLLVSQLILDGYLYQTAEKYSVVKMGNIDRLKNPDTRVLIRTYKDKEPERQTKRRSRKSTDSLTKAGYDLFEILRKLRLSIAREEGLPPYIVFSDKTLIDMSVKAPADKKMMLSVSGVGEAKYEKYGQRFIEAITAFIEDHPETVTSIIEDDAEENTQESPQDRVEDTRKKKPAGAGTSWSVEEDRRLDEEYASGMKISEIAKAHDRTNGAIRSRLKKHGLIE
ncbi:MAG: DNA helicase RecQ [Lachnospiraceae bacterium]|nr:DNA helicase RecQ [Lachnospiraceae bacterium]